MDSCPVCHRGFAPAENRVLIKDCGCGRTFCGHLGHPYHYEHTGCYDGSRGGVPR